MGGRSVGIEIEFTGDRNDALAKLQEVGIAQPGTSVDYQAAPTEGWVIKTDSSVNDGGEMVSHVLDFDSPKDRMQVNAAVRCLREIEAKTSHSAGIHIHVGKDGLTTEEMAMVAKFGVKYEDFLFRIGASGWKTIRANWQQYCHPYAAEYKKTFVDHDFAWHVVGERMDHGAFINVQARNNTFEFRHFNSSLNATRIQGYMALSVAIVKAVRFGRVQRALNRYNTYLLGGMKEGWRDEDALFKSVVRTLSCKGMALTPQDRKLLGRLWEDSKPQDSANHKFAIPGWTGEEAKRGGGRIKKLSLDEVIGNEEFVSEEADDAPPTLERRNYPDRDADYNCTQCGRNNCTCCRYCAGPRHADTHATRVGHAYERIGTNGMRVGSRAPRHFPVDTAIAEEVSA